MDDNDKNTADAQSAHSSDANTSSQRRSNTRLVGLLGLTSIGMFAFAVFVLPPMYDVFCELTGLNGKSDSLARKAIPIDSPELSDNNPELADNSPELADNSPDRSENSAADANSASDESGNVADGSEGSTEGPITIQFLADKHKDMPWTFKPSVFSMKLEPGKSYQTTFHVKNLTAKTITGQAVPSVSPGYMAQYLKKMECFCFSQQTLEGYEEKDMPLSFSIAKDAPVEVSTITLSYMLYNMDEKVNTDQAMLD